MAKPPTRASVFALRSCFKTAVTSPKRKRGPPSLALRASFETTSYRYARRATAANPSGCADKFGQLSWQTAAAPDCPSSRRGGAVDHFFKKTESLTTEPTEHKDACSMAPKQSTG